MQYEQNMYQVKAQQTGATVGLRYNETHNLVTITGVVTEHTNDDFAQNFVLLVNRLSGMQDKIPVFVDGSSNIESNLIIEEGQAVTVRGMFTSYNKIIGDKSKLILKAYAQEITYPTAEENENPNNIELKCFVCKAPIYRTTPFNREIADILVAVNRASNKSDYIPCIAWGKNARFAKNLLIGEKVQINGRIQSREYQKRLDDGSVEIRTAFEVSINSICKEEDALQS
jgi:primosomal replication protein N